MSNYESCAGVTVCVADDACREFVERRLNRVKREDPALWAREVDIAVTGKNGVMAPDLKAMAINRLKRRFFADDDDSFPNASIYPDPERLKAIRERASES
jgi:hypothetical protein